VRRSASISREISSGGYAPSPARSRNTGVPARSSPADARARDPCVRRRFGAQHRSGMLESRKPVDRFVDEHAFTVPKTLTTAERRARWFGSSMARRSIKYRRKRRSRSAFRLVAHPRPHTPHCWRPQIDPVTRLVKANARATSVTERGERIPPQVFLDQIHDAAGEADAEPGQSENPARDVEIHDAEDRILPRFVGRRAELCGDSTRAAPARSPREEI